MAINVVTRTSFGVEPEIVTTPTLNVNLVLNQATPDRTIVEEKAKLPVKAGVVESSQTTTTDVQKGVSSEPFEDTEAADEGPAASNKDYTKEACRKQATHR